MWQAVALGRDEPVVESAVFQDRRETVLFYKKVSSHDRTYLGERMPS